MAITDGPAGDPPGGPEPAPMPAAYFETHFRCDDPAGEWPAEFVIVTAYATTGQVWPADRARAADRRLEADLRGRGAWLKRVTGYSPATGHAEPGWAADLPLDIACAVGREYLQDAINHVAGDVLSVTRCADPGGPVRVGGFRERLAAERPAAS